MKLGQKWSAVLKCVNTLHPVDVFLAAATLKCNWMETQVRLIRSLLSSALFGITGNTCVCRSERWVTWSFPLFLSLSLFPFIPVYPLCAQVGYVLPMHSKQAAGGWRGVGSAESHTRLESSFTFKKSLFLTYVSERICVAVYLHVDSSVRCTHWEEFQAPPTFRKDSFSLFCFFFFFCQWESSSPDGAQFPPSLLSPSTTPTTLNSNLTPRRVEKSAHLAHAQWKRSTRSSKMFSALQRTPTGMSQGGQT